VILSCSQNLNFFEEICSNVMIKLKDSLENDFQQRFQSCLAEDKHCEGEGQ
jgi:hypothetical protein